MIKDPTLAIFLDGYRYLEHTYRAHHGLQLSSSRTSLSEDRLSHPIGKGYDREGNLHQEQDGEKKEASCKENQIMNTLSEDIDANQQPQALNEDDLTSSDKGSSMVRRGRTR